MSNPTVIACKHVQEDEASTSGVGDIPLDKKLGISVRVGFVSQHHTPAHSVHQCNSHRLVKTRILLNSGNHIASCPLSLSGN